MRGADDQVLTAVIVVGCMFVLPRIIKFVQECVQEPNNQEARTKAKEAAIERAASSVSKQGENNDYHSKTSEVGMKAHHHTPNMSTPTSTSTHKHTHTNRKARRKRIKEDKLMTRLNNFLAEQDDRSIALAQASLVFASHATVFRIIPTLPHMEVASYMLERIANEFLPIIERRGYRVQSVSEYYPDVRLGRDSDGLEYQLGGQDRCVQPGEIINGHDISDTRGYNSRLNSMNRVDTIHLRLRHKDNEECFFSYDEVAQTMAHELAHCVHRHHGDSFFVLMKDILEEYRFMLNDGQEHFFSLYDFRD